LTAAGRGAAARSSARAAGVPRYLQVARTLAEAIGSARYAVGAKLPTEAELCRQYRISRYTAREALRQLRESGLISRKRGAGTTVAASAPVRTFSQSLRSLADVSQYAQDTRLRIERQTRVDARVEAANGSIAFAPARRGRAWTRLDAVRVRPGDTLPVCVTSVYLAPEVASVVPLLPKETGPIHGVIEREIGIRVARVDQTIHATSLSEPDARKLAAPAGSPALRVIRRYYDANDRLFEVSDSVHPGERYAYSITLRRD
jgi:GntR family transcriptional regulator